MKRFIDHYLLEWSQEQGRKPLLLRGARQVGKTYAVRQLGKQFDSFIELNLELNPNVRELFKKSLDPKQIINEIFYMFKQEVIPGKTLLFFDEIQAEPQAVTALRYFYEMMPELHVIAAGSLLDFAIEQVGVPVGRVEFLYVYPLSFIEFLGAMDEKILFNAFIMHDPKTEISKIAHARLLKLISEYLAIGGMPEVVNIWVTKQDAKRCFKIQQTLVNAYRQDFNKYGTKFQIKYLEKLFAEMPLQLGKKFKYSAFEGDYRKRELSPCIDLLATAGIIHKVYHTAAQGLPLGAQIDLDDFKIIFLDIGLAQAILGLDLTNWLLDPEQQFVNKGELVEAFIGQEILAYSNPIQKKGLYYWRRTERNSQAEIDYVLQLKEAIVPIEVKSGAGSTLRSMHSFLDAHPKSRYGLRFSTHNYNIFEKIHSYPLYAVAQAIKQELPNIFD